jgi:hypothetical protein
MTVVEKRNRSRTPYVEPDLLEQGISQLSMEIQILTDWLENLDPSEAEPRRSYEDMLRSRHEMLLSLTEQKARLQAMAGDPPPPAPASEQPAS